MNGLVNLIEALDCEKPFLNLVNFDGCRENFIQIKISDLATSFDHACAFPVGTDDSAAINLYFSILTDQPELDRVPEKATQSFEDVRIFCPCADAAIVLEEIRKYRMRVHRNMPEDIMKNVR